MKVFILIPKTFFVECGVDFAAAIDNTKVKVFRTREEAEIFRSELFESWKAIFKERVVKEDTASDTISFQIIDGSRFVFEILERSF